MRQLVTLNARAAEHSKYFDLLMLMVNDIKEKLEKVQEINPGNIDRQELENNIFMKLPVSNEDTLTTLTKALAENSFFNDETVKAIQSTCTNASVKDIELVASVWLTKA
ncbi:putative leucine-rich repeat-containing protein DDB G0290503 isoform X1, partial [Aphis craccivora]